MLAYLAAWCLYVVTGGLIFPLHFFFLFVYFSFETGQQIKIKILRRTILIWKELRPSFSKIFFWVLEGGAFVY